MSVESSNLRGFAKPPADPGRPLDWPDRTLLIVLAAFPLVASVRAWTSADDVIMILYAITLIGGLWRGRPLEEFREWLGIFVTPLGLLAVLFFIYAAISLSWSEMSDYSQIHLLKWTSIVVMATAIGMRFHHIPSVAFQRWFAVATVAGLLLFWADGLSGYPLVQIVYGSLLDRHVNPNAMALSLLLWPALAGIVGAGQRAFAAVAWLVAGVAFVLSSSQASFAGYVVGSTVYLMAHLLPTAGTRLVIAGAVTAMALAPLTSWLAAFSVHWLPQWFLASAFATTRIDQWGKHADLIASAPFFGQGALGIGKNHSHSFPVQIWVEFGAVGAVLVIAIFLVVGGQFAKFDSRYRPFVLAAAAAVYVNFSVSYGLWEIQFLSMVLLASLIVFHGVKTEIFAVKRA